jgi:putative SOS response-associated peptidase YedK
MCGRFVSSSSADEIAKYFGADQVSEQALEKSPNYNTAPTTDVFVVYSDGEARNVDTFHWGLVPMWAKDLKIGNKLINARAETVAEKPAFRSAFKRKRCIIPVDGFYEWAKVEGEGKKKQPYYIERPDGEPYAFAGLWEEWTGTLTSKARLADEAEGKSRGKSGAKSGGKSGDGEPKEVTIRSATIITGMPNEKMSEIHNRMPVILPAESWAEWLDPEMRDTERMQKLLVPAPKELITFHPVSVEVNSVRNQGEHLTDPVDPEADEGAEDPVEKP